MLAANIDDKQVHHIDLSKIKPDSAYRCRIALGAKQRFRRYSNGRWVVKETDSDGRQHLEMNAAIHDVEPMSYETFVGLVQESNDFLAANKSKEIVKGTNCQKDPSRVIREDVRGENGPLYKGDVNRMIIVLDYKPTDEPPTDGPHDPNQSLKVFAKELVNQLVEQLALNKK